MVHHYVLMIGSVMPQTPRVARTQSKWLNFPFPVRTARQPLVDLDAVQDPSPKILIKQCYPEATSRNGTKLLQAQERQWHMQSQGAQPGPFTARSAIVSSIKLGSDHCL